MYVYGMWNAQELLERFQQPQDTEDIRGPAEAVVGAAQEIIKKHVTGIPGAAQPSQVGAHKQ